MFAQKVIGYHGCDRRVGEKILRGEVQLRESRNPYDWLGWGRYFWEDDYARARRFAQRLSQRSGSSIEKPFVIGAVIDLGNCLNLLESENLQLLRDAYENLNESLMRLGKPIPTNRPRSLSNEEDLVLRDLDCAVIEMVHWTNQSKGGIPYDTVRSVFWEGPEVYTTAGFRIYNHIQICVRST